MESYLYPWFLLNHLNPFPLLEATAWMDIIFLANQMCLSDILEPVSVL